MVNISSAIGRQKQTEKAMIAANQIIAAQAEQIAALNQSAALLTTKIEELQAENAKLKKTGRNSSTPIKRWI